MVLYVVYNSGSRFPLRYPFKKIKILREVGTGVSGLQGGFDVWRYHKFIFHEDRGEAHNWAYRPFSFYPTLLWRKYNPPPIRSKY